MITAKQLIIPDRIKVGFQNRQGTYTGKLAYVIYYDQKGVLRKQKSWESWRDDKIEPVEFENKPTEGFVLNKGVGGARQSYGWNARNEYIRVYDPRDFEFEISVANLLFILRECDCNKGKGLEGKFVYSWDGTELVLLPEGSEDYRNSKNYTSLQKCGVKAKELIIGASYTTKKQGVLIYLGKLDYHYVVSVDSYPKTGSTGVVKKYVFWNGDNFEFYDSLKNIAVLQSDAISRDLAKLQEKYYKSENGSPVVEVFLKEAKPNDNYYSRHWFCQEDECYVEYESEYEFNDKTKVRCVTRRGNWLLREDNVLVYESCYAVAYRIDRDRHWDRYNHLMSWKDPNEFRLFVKLESGKIYQAASGNLFTTKKGTENG